MWAGQGLNPERSDGWVDGWMDGWMDEASQPIMHEAFSFLAKNSCCDVYTGKIVIFIFILWDNKILDTNTMNI